MNKKESVKKTETMLENYREFQRKITAFRFRIGHLIKVTEAEVIGQMVMPGRNYGIERADSYFSDTTMHTALNYEERTCSMNSEEISRLEKKLFQLERENEKTEFFVSLLEPRHAKMLRLHYFEGRVWNDVAEGEETSLKTILKRRAVAVKHLAMLAFEDA